MNQNNPYFPCSFTEHDGQYSVVCSHFHYFDEYFGDKGGGGYTVEKLAKKLVREHGIKGVKFDSEASMFCAYSEMRAPLEQLCDVLRSFTGSEEKHLAIQIESEPSIPMDEAEQLLIKGFVISIDESAQLQFLKHVPYPPVTSRQQKLLNLICEGDDGEKIYAAKKINSEARTLVKNSKHYLSHPDTITLFLKCCDENKGSPSVFQELIWALVFICDRHLPDLRTKPYFISCLVHPRYQVRYLGIWGLYNIGSLTSEMLEPLLQDKSKKVRDSANKYLGLITKSSNRTYPSWMFDAKNVRHAEVNELEIRPKIKAQDNEKHESKPRWKFW